MKGQGKDFAKSLELPEYEPMGKEELRQKFLEYRKDKDLSLRNEIVEANLRLVAKVASQYSKRLHVSRGELFQEGSMGLIKAVEDFDPDKNVAFSTLATTYIKNSIFHYLSNDARMIKSGSHDLSKYRKIAMAEDQLMQELRRNVTDEEIFERLDGVISLSEIARLRKGPCLVCSLDGTDKDSGGETDSGKNFSERFADESPDPRETALDHERVQLLFAALSKLSDIDRDIVLSRHGEAQKTLQELAAKYNVSPEAIRQRESRALKKLKALLEPQEV